MQGLGILLRRNRAFIGTRWVVWSSRAILLVIPVSCVNTNFNILSPFPRTDLVRSFSVAADSAEKMGLEVVMFS
jgi:hypothetical protein